MKIFRKKFPTPQEFKEIWQPKLWAKNQKMATKELEDLFEYIAKKLRLGENRIGWDCIDCGPFTREAVDAELAKYGWKLYKPNGTYRYELLPLDSETPEDPPF